MKRLAKIKRKLANAASPLCLVLLTLATPALGQLDCLQCAVQIESISQNESTWKKMTGKDEEFSVLLPGDPSAFFNFITNNRGKRKLERIYSSYSNGSVYLVVSYDGGSLQDTSENFKAHHLYRGEMRFENDLSLDGYNGKQYRLTLGEVTGTVRIYRTKQRAYAVAVVQAIDNSTLTQYFLSSFSLTGRTENPQPGAVKYPPGTQGELIKQQVVPDLDSQAVFSGKDVTRRAVVVSKPEPWFIHEVRQTGSSGIVVLRAVLSSSGEVTDIKVMRPLGRGLTENAIKAARSIRFIPAMKDGRFVSQYIQLEYNFGLY